MSKLYRKARNTVATNLFIKNSPYKPRVVQNKKAYSRKKKHRGEGE